METLNKICNQLDCGIEDILEHIPDWKTDRSRTAKCSNFLTSVYIFRHNVFWNFQSLLIFSMIIELQTLTIKNAYITALAIFRFPINNYFVYLYEFCCLYLYNSTVLLSPEKPRKPVFLQPNPVCDFDPWFYDFGETVMITGSGQKKSYIFRFYVFFSLFWCNDFDVSYTVFVRFFLVTGFFACSLAATFSPFSFSL